MAHHHGTTGSWEFFVLLALAIVSLCLVYLRGWWRLHPKLTKLPIWRAGCFLSGLLLIWVAIASAIAGLDHELLTVHMMQHLLLMTLAPPLIWLGEPALVLSHGLSEQFVETYIYPLFHQRSVRRLSKVFVAPKFALFTASAVLLGWHIPPIFSLAMSSGEWHAIALATFLITGLLFWWPVVQPWPSVHKPELSIILYLFFATLPCDILSGFLVFCDRVVYPSYFSSSHLFGFSALGDQQCAAALMWTCVTVVYLLAGAVLTMRLLSTNHYEHEIAGTAAQQSVSQRLEVA